MGSISHADLVAMQSRLCRGRAPSPASDAVEAGGEVTLGNEVASWLAANGVAFVRGRTDIPSSVTPGSPDLVVAAPGKILLVELKTRVGKLSKEQVVWHHLARRAGHEVHVVRSMGEFMQLINSTPC